METPKSFNERLYPDFLSRDEIELLQNMYEVERVAKDLVKAFTDINPTIPDHKRNEFTDHWRKAENHYNLCSFLLKKMQTKFDQKIKYQ